MPRARRTEPPEPMSPAERKTKLRKAYGQATQDLRDAHKEEFQTMYGRRARRLGIDWSPRMSSEQKAEAEFARLIQAYPHLLERELEALHDDDEPDEPETDEPEEGEPEPEDDEGEDEGEGEQEAR